MTVTHQSAIDEKTIFQYIAETKLLNVLAKAQRPLTFIGDRVTISRLKTEFSASEYQHTYAEWDLESATLKPESKNFTFNPIIIISSIYNEHQIHDQFEIYVAQHFLPQKTPKILKLFSDILVNLLSRHPPFQLSEVKFERPQVNYAILTTPRSGSTFLCDLLQQSDLAGYPAEHLRRPAEILARHCQFDYIRYMKILMTRRATSNQVFGTKLISHFIINYRKEGLDFDAFFKTYFQKFIYLQRRDKIAQAVSLYLAKKTNIWHILNNEMRAKYNNAISKIKIENCKIEEIKSFYNFLLRQEKFIESFLKENEITPFRIDYEDLVASQKKYLNDIFDYLEIDYDDYELDSSTGIKRTKSALTAQLIQKLKDSYPSLG